MGLLVCSAITAQAQGQDQDVVAIVRADIQDGSTGELAQLFADDVDLSLDGEQARYSKDQAEVVLRDFLRHYPVGPATVVREASPSDALRYIVARSKPHSRQPMRMELVLRKENGRFSINSMQMARD